MKDNNPSLSKDTVIVEQYKYRNSNYIEFNSYNNRQIGEHGVCVDSALFTTIALFYEKNKRPQLGYEANKK